MNKHRIGIVESNEIIAPNTYYIVVKVANMPQIKVGQFLMVSVPNGRFTLRRPFVICNHDKDKGTLDFCVVTHGAGTRELVKVKAGESLDMLLPLGNSFPEDFRDKNVLLVSGGIGCLPLLPVAKEFPNTHAFMGFASKKNVILIDEFKKVSNQVFITSDDGSIGEKGFVTTVLRRELKNIKADAIFACGPDAMFLELRKIAEEYSIPTYITGESRMACGFGACLCCNQLVEIDGVRENHRACCEGPVFNIMEVVFE